MNGLVEYNDHFTFNCRAGQAFQVEYLPRLRMHPVFDIVRYYFMVYKEELGLFQCCRNNKQ